MIVLVSVFVIMVLIYFGLIRLLDCKKKEFLQFLVIYTLMIVFMGCLSYIFARERAGENWHLHFHPIRDQLCIASFYAPPTFVVAYLLYPFKTIKRNQILIWALLCYSIISIGGVTLLSILVSFSNM